MRKVTAEEAKTRLDELLRGLEAEDVVIEAEGAPAAVRVPLARRAAEVEERSAWLQAALAEAEAAAERGEEREVDDSALEAILERATTRAA